MSLAPVQLVSVNKTPARAAVLVASMIAGLRPDFEIAHIANSSTIGDLKTILTSLVHGPALLICSSQWTAEEQQEVSVIGREAIPRIKIVNIPPGLDVHEGGDAIVRFLNNAVRKAGIPQADSDGQYEE